MEPTTTIYALDITHLEWAERDQLEHDILVFCLEQTQPLIPSTRFN